MRQFSSFILICLSLCFVASSCKKKFNSRFSVSTNSSNPYDIKFFYDQLSKRTIKKVNAPFMTVNEENIGGEQTYISISKAFHVESGYEVRKLREYAARGNIVFLASFNIDNAVRDSLLFFPNVQENPNAFFPPALYRKGFEAIWQTSEPPAHYKYPGHYIVPQSLDSARLLLDNNVYAFDELVTDVKGKPQILRLSCGKGKIYLCNNPLLLSNYFLLHGDNYTLLNRLFSELEIGRRTILWDDYYRKNRKQEDQKGGSFLMLFWQYAAIRWAFLTLFIACLFYFVFNTRRIVQIVDKEQKTKKSEEHFAQVISQLYWQQKDHGAIAFKFFKQFYEYLFTHFKLTADDIQKEKLTSISIKTGKSEAQFLAVLQDIEHYKSTDGINESDLLRYHKNLNHFYQNPNR
ncbi:hypothetical protein LAG90_00735 [Marinilongibacter aquaticus]|uniref:DUF4350 domain-containing protein n=1 Tax=Marinilongibacter aquaticus TaxID=2975157 RepID=UPI0021BD8914|nr:DUF4350 domain-containing protein [Marinilongibacter aquaticus]UBM59184.1 hypothetical protein LAG90_00735 [Marinilongibacter aquaticus]